MQFHHSIRLQFFVTLFFFEKNFYSNSLHTTLPTKHPHPSLNWGNTPPPFNSNLFFSDRKEFFGILKSV